MHYDQALIERITARRDTLRAQRLRHEQETEPDAAMESRFEALPPVRFKKSRHYAEEHTSALPGPIEQRSPLAIKPMRAEYCCCLTGNIVEPIAVLSPECVGRHKVVWWRCPDCDQNKRTKRELLFKPSMPAAHVLILDLETPVPPRRRIVEPERPKTPIPVVGEASSPAELVTLLKRAHFQRHGAAEHDVDLDERYVAVETETEAA